MKKVLLVITGSIAAYKSMDLLRLLKKNGYDVSCILTKAAQEFITPLLVTSLCGSKVYSDLFSEEDEAKIGHINLSRQADLIVVAPASADFIAKIANGYANDLASSVLLAANKKIMIAPAMNEKMWENKATQENLAKALESGISIVEPTIDVLACGEFGLGKMASPEKIFEKITKFFANQNLLKGKKILLTGGSTIEPIDPVRFIGNHSSGKQAIEIAKILDEMGADVTFIAGNIAATIPLKKEKIIRIKTAQEMFDAVKNIILGRASDQGSNTSKLERSSTLRVKDDGVKIDVFVACAAVADFKMKKVATQKIKKTAEKNLTLELEKNPDILDFVGHAKNRPTLVIGFAAEGENLEKNAREKLHKKNCDLVIANNIDDGKIFGANESEVIFVTAKKTEKFGKISKTKLARVLAEKLL